MRTRPNVTPSNIYATITLFDWQRNMQTLTRSFIFKFNFLSCYILSHGRFPRSLRYVDECECKLRWLISSSPIFEKEFSHVANFGVSVHVASARMILFKNWRNKSSHGDAGKLRSRGVCTTIPRNKLNVVSSSTHTIILLIKQHFTWSFHNSVVTTSESSFLPRPKIKSSLGKPFELPCLLEARVAKDVEITVGWSFQEKISISWSSDRIPSTRNFTKQKPISERLYMWKVDSFLFLFTSKVSVLTHSLALQSELVAENFTSEQIEILAQASSFITVAIAVS